MTTSTLAYVRTNMGIQPTRNANHNAFNHTEVVVAGRTQREAMAWATNHGLKGAHIVSPEPTSRGPRGTTTLRAIFITPQLAVQPQQTIQTAVAKAKPALIAGAPLLPTHYNQKAHA